MTFQKEIDELKIISEKLEHQTKIISENVKHNYLFISDFKDTMVRANMLLVNIRNILADERTKEKRDSSRDDRKSKKKTNK